MYVNNNNMQRTKLLYVTFRRDINWIRYSLQSFRKFCSGFAGVTIVVPVIDIDIFLPLEAEFSTPECPVFIRTFLEFPQKGFCHHMAMICSADIFCPDATHILHIDPDCLFTRPTTPYDYFVDEKPVLLIESFDAIMRRGHTGRFGWKKVVEDALRIPARYETMCRHGAIHYKWLYKAVREHIECRHQIPFVDYVLRQQNAFPQTFAEFPTLGAYAVEMYSDKYHLIDRGFDEEKNDPVPHIQQLWAGHTEPDRADNQAEIQRILG